MLASLQSALALAACRHRAPNSPTNFTSMNVCEESRDKLATYSDVSGDEDCKSTDTSGAEQIVESSSDSSDTDGADLAPNSEPSSAESDSDWEPSITPRIAPKVRELPARRKRLTRRRQAGQSKRLTSAAHPSHGQSSSTVEQRAPVRKSVKAVISALDSFMASNTTAERQSEADMVDKEAQNQSVDVLQHALANLSSHDVAMMKALLDAKLARQ